jgi:hypothetical protein
VNVDFGSLAIVFHLFVSTVYDTHSSLSHAALGFFWLLVASLSKQGILGLIYHNMLPAGSLVGISCGGGDYSLEGMACCGLC